MANRNRDDSGFLLLSEADEPFEKKGWVGNIKHDGRRVQVEKRGDSISFWGRDNIVENRYPEVIEAFKQIKHNFKVDCEFAVFEDEWKTNRGSLQTRDRTKDKFKIRLMSKTMPVTPAIFDLLEIDGNDMTNKPYEERKKALSEAFSGKVGVKVIKDYENPLEAWEIAEKYKLEGIVERDKTAPYIEGRSVKAVKIKRKGLFPVKMVRYEMNNAGIKLFSQDGVKCQCSGQQSAEVKELIDTQGYAGVNVRGMGDKTKAGKIREPVFGGLIND